MSVHAAANTDHCQTTPSRELGLENLHRLGITAFAYPPLQLASPNSAPDIIQRMTAYVEEKKQRGTLPPGLAEQWDIQLRVLKDPTLPDMEVIGYPGFFKVAFSCKSSMHRQLCPSYYF